jgi:methyl-accepting chemotaxis protein
VAGAFGIDVKMENVQTIMAEGSILSDGYMVVLSPDGSFATHRDASRVLENYKTTWLGAYANQVDDLLKNGGSLSVHAYSDVTNSYVRLLMNTIMIGNTGRYWSIMGIIPENTATASASQLILTVVAAGLILILLVGVLVFLLVSGSLKKLPSITAMAGNIAAGDLKMNTVSDKSPTKNEIALLERSFSGVVNVVNTLVSDIKEVGRAVLIDGDIEAAVDAEKYQGSYREVVESVNSMLQEQIKDTLQLLGCLNEYGNGNFDANVTKLPGKKIVMNETVDKLSYNLKSLSKDIDGLVQDAIQGKLASRVDVTDYQGDWAHLMTEMNTLLETIVAPINEASDVLGYVSAGNFDHQVQGNYQGDFIKIKDSINTTVTNVSSYISEISEVLTNLANNNLDQAVTREYVGSYASIKEALNNIIGTLNNVIGDIASAAEQVAAGARAISESSMAMATGATEQASSVEELNATIITINESTLRNSESAKDAENLSLQSKQNAASGDEDMKRMLDSINGIKESSNNIAKIIKSIEEIAFQTNLLALNAAVEAARAGEHGKGFMVVAEEVRNLASRSQTAAKETAALIDESVTRVNEGTEIADKTASALKTIVDDVSHVADLISNIANASHEQAEAISQVTDGLSHITEVVTNNSATSEEAASASQELSSQSEIMRNLVAVFKMK